MSAPANNGMQWTRAQQVSHRSGFVRAADAWRSAARVGISEQARDLCIANGARLFVLRLNVSPSPRAAALRGTLNATQRTLNGSSRGRQRALNLPDGGAPEQANAADREQRGSRRELAASPVVSAAADCQR